MGDLKYKVGDKVRIKSLDWYNKNKNEHGSVNCPPYTFLAIMCHCCGKIYTINSVDNFAKKYTMTEDGGHFDWTDEMIEGIAEEKYQPKFNIGDVVYSKTWQRNVVIMEILPGGFYAVGELYGTGCTGWFKTHEDNLCKDIVKLDNPTYDNMVEELMENKNNHLTETVVDTVRESNDRYRIVTDPRFDIEVDEGEYYAVRRKNEYPKTYEECCKVLGILNVDLCFNADYRSFNASNEQWKKLGLMNQFYQLLICRDAYWKLYGEEMGLGKPWEPDWREERYIIYRNQDIIIGGYREAGYVEHHIFEFPTKELKDNFFNAFRDDIEKCTELL